MLAVVLMVICAYLQVKMCKRNHEACQRNVPRDHKVIGVSVLGYYSAYVG